MQRCIAEYLRISLEDGDMEDESNSITNQRIILRRYVDKKKEFEGWKVLEFKDDGYSGTNFERPEFQKMMELVRAGEIHAIIVKDLSRFGRNHIEVGSYIEQIFPFLGIRFIAVNDYIDSQNYKGGVPDTDVGFRNIINEFYSHDVSVKVKSSLVQKRKDGKYMGARAPYGYLKPEDDVTSLIVNPETAPIVKKIFHMYLNEYNITQVARKLNEEGILCPGRYKREVLQSGVKKQTENEIWYPTTVRFILTTETYMGTTVGGKYRVASVGSSKHILNSEEEWIKVEHTHEAIITPEVFWAVQEKLERNSRKKKNGMGMNRYPLKGVMVCGGCGQRLQYISRCRPHFLCARRFTGLNGGCISGNLYEEEINRFVLNAIRKFAALADKASEIFEEERSALIEQINSATKEQQKLTGKIEREKQRKTQLYMDFALEEIEQAEYENRNRTLNTSIERSERKMQELEEKKNTVAEKLLKLPDRSEESLTEIFNKEEKLTQDMVNIFIKEIRMYDDNRMEIQWNFQDEMQKAVRKLEKEVELAS